MRVARLEAQRTQAFVLANGTVVIRMPVSGKVVQRDIAQGQRALNQDVRRVLEAIEGAGFKAKRTGWALDMEWGAFSERILVTEGKVKLDQLTQVVESVPGIAAASAPRVASRKMAADNL